MYNFAKNSRAEDEPVIVSATGRHTATIIFLHGLGDSGHGWSSSIAAIKPTYAKSLCPNASTIPVTINGGLPMPSWFDRLTLDPSGPVDEAGIEAATNLVHEMIRREEQAGISSERIILGGFSQGGALALHSGLTYPKPLGGIIALSCYLPMPEKLSFTGNANLNTPILHCHGTDDTLILLEWAQMSNELLKKHLPKYQFKAYSGVGHSACEEERDDLKKFIEENLS